jgi:hypothetical protein
MISIPGLRYLGHFAVAETDRHDSPTRFGGSNCVIAVRDSLSLWVAGQRGRYFAPVPIPDTLAPGVPTFDARGWHTSPVAVPRSSAWQQFYDPAVVNPIVSPERVDCRGLLVHYGKTITTVHKFYNANLDHIECYWHDGRFRKTDPTPISKEDAISGQYTAGYLARVPEKWRAAIGSEVVCGNHPHQQTGSAYLGPAIIALNPDTGEVNPIMHPHRSWWRYSDNGTDWYRSPDSSNAARLANDRATKWIQYTTQTTGLGILGGRAYHWGVLGRGRGWYGEQTVTMLGTTYKDIANSTKGYHNEARGWACWSTPMKTIASAAAGVIEPWDCEADMVETRFDTAIPGMFPTERGVGCAVDHASNRMYVAVSMRMNRANAEWTPVILAFEGVPEEPEVRFWSAPEGVRIEVDGTTRPSPKLADWLNASDEAKRTVVEENH